MLTLDDFKYKLKNLLAKFEDCCLAFDEEKMQSRFAVLDELRSSPDLYSNPKRAAEINAEAKYISDKLDELKGYRSGLDDLSTLIELVEMEDGGDEYLDEIENSLSSLTQSVDSLFLQTLLKGE